MGFAKSLSMLVFTYGILVGQFGCTSKDNDRKKSIEASDPVVAADDFTVDCEISSAIGTVGIVTWATNVDPVDNAYIEFGLDSSYGMKAPVDLNEPQYRTLLLGMKGEHDYHFRVVVESGNSQYSSDDYTLTTGPVTNLVQVLEMNIDDEDARSRGFVITGLFQNGGMGGFFRATSTNSALAFIVDADGDIVWWYTSSLTNITRARMSYNGKYLWMVTSGMSFGGNSIERVSMDGLDSKVFTDPATHDITAVSGDVMAYLGGGFTSCVVLTEITPDGTTKPIYDTSQLFGFGPCHGNAIRYSETEGVYTLSELSQGDVLWIDRETGSLVQRLTDFSYDWGRHQHGHHLLDDSIVLFNNGSRIAQEISLDPDTKQSAEIWRYSSEYNSQVLGDVQRLPNGNTMVTYSTAGRIHEVDPNGARVMELRFSGTIGYAAWQQSLYDPPVDITM